MQTIKSTILTGIVLLSLSVSAQTIIKEQDNEFDRKYTPPQGSLFNDLGGKNNSSSHGDDVDIQNTVKFIPTAIFRQKIVFSYQRQIYNGLTAGVTLGKAFGRDYLQDVSFAFWDEINSSGDDSKLSGATMLSNCTYNGSSPLLGLNLRAYYGGDAFNGGFVEINFAYERMSYILNPDVLSYQVYGSKNFDFKMKSLGLTFGNTFTTGHFTHEIAFNTGIKLFKTNPFYKNQVQNLQTGNTDYYYAQSTTENTSLIIYFSFGYALGFGF